MKGRTRRLAVVAAAVLAAAALGLPGPALANEPAPKVAIIVGPVGEELTPAYLRLAEATADAAESRGASVARAYSPNATPARVLAAVDGAQIVVYFGHGVGFPNPYSATLNPATANGWGLQGPAADGSHADSWRDGTLAYYGEAWLAAHARPAPGFVMIYSNVCYAPGAGELWMEPATHEEASARVAAYSGTPFALGASAYYATDYDLGAARLVDALLGAPQRTYGEIFGVEPRFDPGGLARHAHPSGEGREIWLQQAAYVGGRVDYWYAFAGDPSATPAATLLAGLATRSGSADAGLAAPAGDPAPPSPGQDSRLGQVPADPPSAAHSGAFRGIASHYPQYAPWLGEATVTLPPGLGVAAGGEEPRTVVVCGDLGCVELPVVDTCPCYWATTDQRVANLSREAWALVTERPLSDGLVEVLLFPNGLPEAAPPVAERP